MQLIIIEEIVCDRREREYRPIELKKKREKKKKINNNKFADKNGKYITSNDRI